MSDSGFSDEDIDITKAKHRKTAPGTGAATPAEGSFGKSSIITPGATPGELTPILEPTPKSSNNVTPEDSPSQAS